MSHRDNIRIKNEYIADSSVNGQNTQRSKNLQK